jgi:hypothetical protein
MAFITRSAQNLQMPRNNFQSHFDWTMSLDPWFFFTPWGHFTKSHLLRKVTLVDFDKVARPCFARHLSGLCSYIWNLVDFFTFCRKSAKCAVYTVQCTVYTEYKEWLCRITPAACQIAPTPYHECTRSHQLRTMTERGHINSVPWLNAVTSTPYHECTQIVDSVKSLSFSLTMQKIFWTNCVHSWYGVGVTAFMHGTKLMRFGKVTLQSTKISIKWLWPVKVT